MPPTFGYMVLFMIWASFAVLVWAVAALLLIPRRTRRAGRCLFLAMAGAFPGVIIFQIVAAPIVVALLAIAGLFWRIGAGATPTTSGVVVSAARC